MKLKPEGWTENQTNVAGLFMQGMTEVDVAAALGMTRANVNRILNDIARKGDKLAHSSPNSWKPEDRFAAREQLATLLATHGVKKAKDVVDALWATGWNIVWVGLK